MLLDANGLIYRAYFALFNTPLTTSKGQLVNAIFGFWSIVLRGYQDVHPDYVIACFDLAGPTFRHEQYQEYKATRRPMPDDLREQFPRVRELIQAFHIPIYELQGFEADDLIGTLTLQAEARPLATTIVSGDLDMLQLVTDLTHVMTTRGGVQQTVTYEPATVFERYGLTPGQMIDFKALKGDTTDNVPGIPGVGEKTAAKLLQDYGDLDAVYARSGPGPAGEAAPQAAGAPRPGDGLAVARDDPPRPAGDARPERCRAGRVRPGRGHAPLPRVRVPLAGGAPAAVAWRSAASTRRPLARGGRGRRGPRRGRAWPFAVHAGGGERAAADPGLRCPHRTRRPAAAGVATRDRQRP